MRQKVVFLYVHVSLYGGLREDGTHKRDMEKIQKEHQVLTTRKEAPTGYVGALDCNQP